MRGSAVKQRFNGVPLPVQLEDPDGRRRASRECVKSALIGRTNGDSVIMAQSPASQKFSYLAHKLLADKAFGRLSVNGTIIAK